MLLTLTGPHETNDASAHNGFVQVISVALCCVGCNLQSLFCKLLRVSNFAAMFVGQVSKSDLTACESPSCIQHLLIYASVNKSMSSLLA